MTNSGSLRKEKLVIFKSLFLAATLAISATAVAQSPTPSAAKREAQVRAVQSVVNTIQGTWTLKERLTPSGAPHKKPLEGTTVFDLQIVRPSAKVKGAENFLAGSRTVHATGSLRSTERGVLDASQCVNQVALAQASYSQDEASQGSQLFEIEATSKLDLELSAASLAKGAVSRGSVITLTHSDLNIKGTYGVFRNGIRTARVVNSFRVGELSTSETAKGEKMNKLSLVSGPRLNVPRIKTAGPAAFGSLEDKSHQFKSLVVDGDTMYIEWGNGGKDVWVRTKM